MELDKDFKINLPANLILNKGQTVSISIVGDGANLK